MSEETGEYLVSEFIINISQMLCFPFAIDANEEIIGQTYKIIKEFNLFMKIMSACMSNSSFLVCDIPIGLVSRLVLTDEDILLMIIDQLNNSPKVYRRISLLSYRISIVKCLFIQLGEFFSRQLNQASSSDSLIADIFSIFSHLSRKSEDIVPVLIKILRGPTTASSPVTSTGNGAASFQILIKSLNGNAIVKARCCNMIGNLMKHNDLFYDVLKKNKVLFESLVKCCQLDELNVRKV